MRFLLRFLKSEEGPTTVEYAVVLAGILMVCASAISLVGGASGSFWTRNDTELDAVLD